MSLYLFFLIACAILFFHQRNVPTLLKFLENHYHIYFPLLLSPFFFCCFDASGRDKNAYYHEYFLRGRPLLAQKITRTKVKGRGARKASSPETEPQLYDLPWLEAPPKANKGEQQAPVNKTADFAMVASLTH